MVKIMKIFNHKGGWLEIVEAFVSVLLVATVLLIILNKGYFQKTDTSEQVYNTEVSIIREVQTDEILRESVAAVSTLPIRWDEAGFPPDVKSRITTRTPNYLACVAKICEMGTPCPLEGKSLEDSKGKDVYSESGVISATLQGTGATVTVNAPSGIVTGISVTKGGSKYVSGTIVAIIGTGSGAIGTITASGGIITGISITRGGSGYTNGESATISNIYRQLNLFCWTI
jgi:hypothetical protein